MQCTIRRARCICFDSKLLNRRNLNVSTKNAKTPASSETNPAAMDQVRDLLFGSQIKEMDTRLLRQEERFTRALEDTKSAVKNRIESLENFMKSEVASILARIKQEQTERDNELKNEQRERGEAIAKLTKELASTADNFERKLAKVTATLDATERELRELLLSESRSLAEKIEEKYQESLNVLQNTASQIRSDMVHRATLASMFTEVALKLNGQWSPETQGSVPGENAAQRNA